MELQMNNGAIIPAIGLGTRQIEGVDSVKLVAAVKEAIDIGYRHFDCAYFYQCEKDVGKAIRDKIEEGVISREDIFLTSKLWAIYCEEDRVEISIRKSLDNFGLDFLDLYLIHVPIGIKDTGITVPTVVNIEMSDVDYLETWRGMEKCLKMGLTKSIGVSNFNIQQVQRVLDNCQYPPVMNQVECHPYLSQKELVDFCLSKGVLVTGYCPLGASHRKTGKAQIMDEPLLLELSQKHGKSKAQVILRWMIQRQIIPIPKSNNSVHLKENLDVFNFELSKEDMDAIYSLNKNERVISLQWAKDHRFFPF